ncbi:MAG: beta-eliminating lyase-related protein, partial [Trebonia sp.]
GDEHFAQPGVVAITQSTEVGTCYSLAELRKVREFCADNGLRVFMDGARLANAAAYLGCTLAELAEQADVLSFGGTKNGAMGVEAVIVMRSGDAANAPYLRKQHMQLSSKMRFLAAQFIALLDDDLWLQNARHANAMASRLAAGLADLPGVDVVYPVEADAVFARMARQHVAELQREWTFHVWDETTSVVRWMTAFDTQERDVDDFLASIAAVARR